MCGVTGHDTGFGGADFFSSSRKAAARGVSPSSMPP